MKTRRSNTIRRMLLSVALLAAVAGFVLPTVAMAATPSEGAIIINVANVAYEDTAGTSYNANAATLVTVSLAPAALTVSGAPTAGNPGDDAAVACPPTVNSGATATVINAISANANGVDTYTLALNNISTTAATNESVTIIGYNAVGGTVFASTAGPQNVALGSSLVLGVENATTLQFDGGVDLAAMFAADDIVVVKIGGAPVAYRVVSVTNGSAVAHDNAGGTPYDTQGNTTAAVNGLLELGPFQTTINTVTYGSNTTPDFGTAPPAAGDVVGEMVLVQTSVTADSTTQGTDGTVDYDFDTEDSSAANTTTDSCTVTFNAAAELTITKLVRNVTTGGAFAATAGGLPGQVLEYQVTVDNPDSSDANAVVVTDVIPVYTTLVNDGTNFATVDDGTNPVVTITLSNADQESVATASGNTTGIAAGETMTFYLGPGNDGIAGTGGTLAGGESMEIVYQVTID